MFFKSDAKKVQKLRLEFEDIRQRVINKQNQYEKQNFWVVYSDWNEKIWENSGHKLGVTDSKTWISFQKDLKRQAESAWREGITYGGGLMGQDMCSAANAIALASVKCGAFAFATSEAEILREDISEFEKLNDLDF